VVRGRIEDGSPCGSGSATICISSSSQAAFDKALEVAFRHRWLTLLCGVASVVAAGWIATLLPQAFFPKVDRNPFAVEVYLPNGNTLAKTDQVVKKVEEGDYPVRVIVQDDDKARTTYEGLLQQHVSPMWLDSAIPLEQVAHLKPGWSDGAIIRRNGIPTLTVRIDIAMGVVNSDVRKKVEALVASLGPTPGVKVQYGGEKEMAGETYPKLGMGLAITVAAIYLILLAQFRKHRLALLIMGTMPLSLFGTALGLLITGFGIGFTTFIGVISLMGIVVRNGIILIGYAEKLRAQGMDKRRMRPIYLTTMAAAIGATPLIIGGSLLWGPLGAVTTFGLFFSMILTLFVLPVAYDLISRDKAPAEARDSKPAPMAATEATA
jgi:multidrug efflux pump subunit AcrB